MTRDMVQVIKVIEKLDERVEALETSVKLLTPYSFAAGDIMDKIAELEADDQATAAQALRDILEGA